MLLYVITGLLLLAAEPPFGVWPLAYVALIPLVHASRNAPTYRRAAAGGLLAGCVFFLPGLFWLTSTTVLGWAALAIYCAVYLLLFALLARFTANTLALAAGWTLLEWVRGTIAFTGFPWLLLSHSQYRFTTSMQILDLLGSYGLSGLLVILNILLWKSIVSRSRPHMWAAAGLFAAVVFYGILRIQTVPVETAQRVGVVQASVPQEMKEALEGSYDPVGGLSRYLNASAAMPGNEKIDLLVWPETVVLSPYTLNVDPAILQESLGREARFAQGALATLAQKYDAYFLVGSTSFLPAEYGYVSDAALASQIPSGNWRRQYNSAYLLDQKGQYVARYDKMHLVPFGEYIPLRELFPFLAKLVPFDASLNSGETQTIFEMNAGGRALKFGVLICYEDTDAGLARQLRRHGADFLVNISNDAWFGLSELDQHFVTARFRAVENRVGVVRSGNNGLSGVIDPLGRAEIVLGKNEIGSATAVLQTSPSRSLYTVLGDWPELAASALALALELARRRKVADGK